MEVELQMPRDGSGVYSLPANTEGIAATLILSSRYNAFLADLVADLNAARPVSAGGTGVTSLASLQFPEGTAAAPSIRFVDANSGLFQPTGTPSTGISADGVETLRVTTTHLMIGKTAANPAVVGIEAYKTGFLQLTRGGDTVLVCDRRTDDGIIISLQQAGTGEGSISVAGTTVTYASFCGSHESQLLNEAERARLLRGTVIETVDKLADWYKRDEVLAKCKISDTPKSRNVYGVFFSWYDNKQDDDTLNVASLGAFCIRIDADEKVTAGDLLVSAGNGCAMVQDDDIVRSSTIAKVTATKVLEKYKDGSYVVACTLHCG